VAALARLWERLDAAEEANRALMQAVAGANGRLGAVVFPPELLVWPELCGLDGVNSLVVLRRRLLRTHGWLDER